MSRPLFDRTRSGVVPTDAGQLMLRRAKAILGQTDNLMRKLGGMGIGEQEEIRVAAGPSAAGTILGPPVASMLNKRTGPRLKIVMDHWVDTILSHRCR